MAEKDWWLSLAITAFLLALFAENMGAMMAFGVIFLLRYQDIKEREE